MNKDELIGEALAADFWFEETKQLSGSGLFSDFALQGGSPHTPATSVEVELDAEITREVIRLCNNSDVLMYVFYATVISILVHKYFRREDLLMAAPYGQFEKEEGQHKYFLFKSHVDVNRSFKDIFVSNKQFVSRALNYCMTGDEIKRLIGADKLDALGEIALLLKEDTFDLGEQLSGILFSIVKHSHQYSIRLQFPEKSYERDLLKLLAHNFKKLLEEIVEKKYSNIDSLGFHSDQELRLLREFNSVSPYFSLKYTIPELIHQQALACPDKIAVRFNGQTIDYATLDRRSGEFASYLDAHHSLKEDALFGVVMHRSVNMAECILGIWKAGAAYIPIDVHCPVDRMKALIEDSGMLALITDGTTPIPQLEKLDIRVISMDKVRQTPRAFPDTLPLNRINPHSLAYVIYTSGSTGKPKGVMIEHQGMTNHIGSKIIEMGIGQESVVAQNAPHTFDISVWQLFSGLAAGGTTVIYDKDVLLDPVLFIEKIESDKVSVLELVPSYLVELLRILEEGARSTWFSHLKVLILNAETLMPSMVKRWLTLYPHIPIVNTYGATEASDDISHYIMHTCPSTPTVPVLSRPIQNFEVLIVDEQMQLTPIGVKGEILLAGPSVGRGYLNDAEKTAMAFLKGPLPGITGQLRIYRTGDLGRYRADGTMEFLGRRDTQVKVNGNRIELGEIEHTLMGIQEISNCTVLTGPGHEYLVAYYQAETRLPGEYISGLMASKLPAYMLPRFYIHLERLPLNSNGKIDKAALPAPETKDRDSAVEYIAPRNEMEIKMVSIWQELLGKEKIGIKDNFFEAGGQSLKAMKLLSHIHKEFNTRLKWEELFNYGNIEEICKIISRRQWVQKSIQDKKAGMVSDKSFIL